MSPPSLAPTDGIVYVVDDDPSVRAALADLLESVSLKVQSFASTQAFQAATRPDVPSCLVLDVRMPGQSGMDFHQRMAAMGLNLPVIFITGHGDIAMGVQAMKNGAVEFLPKPFRDQDLLDAIHLALEKDRIQRQERAACAALEQRWARLSPGEQAVAQGVVEGLLNKQIADQLHLSEITVKVRRSNVMRKLDVKTLPELVRIMEKLKRQTALSS